MAALEHARARCAAFAGKAAMAARGKRTLAWRRQEGLSQALLPFKKENLLRSEQENFCLICHFFITTDSPPTGSPA